MKNILCKTIEFIGTLVGIVLALIVGICFILLLPFDYIKYKRSIYYKTERKKYKLFAASGIYFELYNEIIKNRLPIKYIYNPNDDCLERGWFVFEDTLIILSDFSFEYDTEGGKWQYFCGEGVDDDGEKSIIMSLDEYIETEIQEANDFAGRTICSNAIVLVDAICIENAELAKRENTFLVYDDNRVDVLRNFCDKNVS